ncbi:MAG: hypothetical protein IPM25_07920 [Chloracidobacterium sp.]|nr:hypothetical protein [Chloracidobacterium sp.]
MTVEFDPSFHLQGKYLPRVALVQYIANDKMIVNSLEATATKTLWHEMLHRLIFRVGGGSPCSEEEVYAYMNEDRVSWLQRVERVEQRYRAGEYTAAILRGVEAA